MNRPTGDDEYGPESLSPSIVDGDPGLAQGRADRPTLDALPDDGEDEVEAPRSRAPLSEAEVAAKIRSLEERLDEMIGHADDASEPAIPPPPPSRFASARPVTPAPDATVFDTARELLSSEFYLRKWGRLGMRNRSEEVDDFGFDPVYEQKVMPFFDFLYDRYFRVECEGIAGVPDVGRCLLVANHSGTLPYDGMMIKTAVKREHPKHRDVRWLAEDFLFHFPFLGSFTNRIGAVRACQENAERLLEQESLTAVFPEGVKGIGKLFRKRYQLQRFGRGGFIKLSLRTRAPIVPVAVVGAEETNPMLFRIDYLSRALGVPYIPVTPTFPLLGPLGLLPLPTKWRIVFGEPVSFDEYGPEAAEDEMLVGRLAEQVRDSIQTMLDRAVKKRASVWLG
jgi:1-acyl-sn-glycerol-3-phosphate acyltransferase